MSIDVPFEELVDVPTNDTNQAPEGSSVAEYLTMTNVENSTNKAQAKFQLTNYPPPPSKCSSCGVGSNGVREFVDFNLSIDYYGAVLFCFDCSLEMINLFEYVSPRKVSIYRKRTEEALEEIDELKVQLEALKNVVSVFNLDKSSDSSDSSNVSESIFDSDDSEDEKPRVTKPKTANPGPFE